MAALPADDSESILPELRPLLISGARSASEGGYVSSCLDVVPVIPPAPTMALCRSAHTTRMPVAGFPGDAPAKPPVSFAPAHPAGTDDRAVYGWGGASDRLCLRAGDGVEKLTNSGLHRHRHVTE